MSQFNAKKCGFSSFKKERPKGVTHRIYRGPHAHCAPGTAHAWNHWRVYEDPARPKTWPTPPSLLPSHPAQRKHDRAHPVDQPTETPAMQTQTPASDTFTVRIMWVRRSGKELSKRLSLFNRLSDEGMAIWVHEAPSVVGLVIEDIPDFDLILFEYFDHIESEIKAVISQIRLASRAPLMMLTDDQSVAWTVDALNAGADAIFTINTPDEVILARCNALLRRWLASA